MVQTFLGTAAPASANLVLLLELAMGIGLIFGGWLARRGLYRRHAWCQSTIVLLNLVVIAVTMVPSFETHVRPKLPARLSRSFYAVATIHAAFGSVAELLALYILLVAGTRILPEWLRFSNFKAAMRGLLVLWWIVLLLGLATYVRWYVPRSIWR